MEREQLRSLIERYRQPMPSEGPAPHIVDRSDAVPRAPENLKVLIVHPGSQLYGSDRVMLDTARSLVARGWSVTAAIPESGPLVEALIAARAEVVMTPSPVIRRSALTAKGFPRFTLDVIRSISPSIRLVRSAKPDVVLVSTITLPSWPVIARLLGRPVVVHVHEAERDRPLPLRRLLALPLRLATAVIANSHFTATTIAENAPSVVRRLRTVVNPVQGPASRTPLAPIPPDPLKVLFVGRLSPRKGPQHLIEALSLVNRPVQLRLLGDTFQGYEWFEESLRRSAASCGDDIVVEFSGFESEVWAAMAASDVVVVPSVELESFGNVAVEAVLAGRPVIATRAGGLEEAVHGYRTARLVPPEDSRAIAAALDAVADDWSNIVGESDHAALQAAERHSVDRFGAEIDAILREVVTDSRT